ncbi:MAG: hypothetical protein A3G92_02640 [Deltaproteobacteria bacterium RIFCSPLOWO2_12_FULL_38_8]|nr:MAG: hypothetical protein A3G92_02640 [Deltaproteobacteria bacterium RIFCSPLOWO2_12_FULL_38_8]
MYFKKLSLLFLLVLIMMGCAKERPIKHVLPEIQRVEKASFTTDDYYYNVTVVGASPEASASFIGDQSFGTSLMRWSISQNSLTGYLVDPRYQENDSLKEPLFSFPIEKHVDIERQKNSDDEVTHIEAEIDTEHSWKERKYANINFAKVKIIPSDFLMLQLYETYGCISEISSDLLDIKQDSDSLNMNVLKTYRTAREREECGDISGADTFTTELKFSFLKKKTNPSFKPIKYSKGLQNKVGLYKTTLKKLDQWNNPIEEDYATHWDPTRKIIYYFTKNFPDAYKPLVKRVFEHWNVIKPILEIRDNTGEQELGDLRYNFIAWLDDPVQNRLLGYGPFHWDPFTGEIVNATAFIYAGNFKQEVQDILENIERDKENTPKKTSEFSGLESHENSFDIQKDVISSPYSYKNFLSQATDTHSFKGALYRFTHLTGRCYYPAEEKAPQEWYKDGLTSQDIFQRLIADSLVHELGHNLGLRHNFKGSVDKAHFISEKSKTSSAMDYLSPEDTEEEKPGPYDKAALTFAFTGEFDIVENYLYCTDEDTHTDPLCNHWDQGTTALEIATYLSTHYWKDYEKRNNRGKRLHFKNTDGSNDRYLQYLLQRYFLPLREFLDYEMHIRNTGMDIKGEPLSLKEQGNTIKDLHQATLISFKFFRKVLLDKSRPYKDMLHPYMGNHEILIRGTLLDKVLATLSLTTRHVGIPLWNVQRANYFDLFEFQIPMLNLFAQASITSESFISFYALYQLLNNVPGEDNLRSGTFSSHDIIDFFKIDEIPLTKENLSRIKAQTNTLEYFVDEERAVIISAKKNAHLILDGTPGALLIHELIKTHADYMQLMNTDLGVYNTLQEESLKISVIMEKLEEFSGEDLSTLDPETLKSIKAQFVEPITLFPKKRALEILTKKSISLLLLQQLEALTKILKIEEKVKALPIEDLSALDVESKDALQAFIPDPFAHLTTSDILAGLEKRQENIANLRNKELETKGAAIQNLNMTKKMMGGLKEKIRLLQLLYKSRVLNIED